MLIHPTTALVGSPWENRLASRTKGFSPQDYCCLCMGDIGMFLKGTTKPAGNELSPNMPNIKLQPDFGLDIVSRWVTARCTNIGEGKEEGGRGATWLPTHVIEEFVPCQGDGIRAEYASSQGVSMVFGTWEKTDTLCKLYNFCLWTTSEQISIF